MKYKGFGCIRNTGINEILKKIPLIIKNGIILAI